MAGNNRQGATGSQQPASQATPFCAGHFSKDGLLRGEGFSLKN
jgi:hypothetical protein